MRNKSVALLLLIFLLFGFSFNSFAQTDFEIPRLSPFPSQHGDNDVLKVSLDGIWNFKSDYKEEYLSTKSVRGWEQIVVPGEWSMQGFRVDSGAATTYFRTFNVNDNWAGNRIKLRFDGVYSKSIVYVNGKEAGSHHGGFTAFELDITDFISFNDENTLVLSVTNESLADSLASGSRYACHPLGGITRSVYIFPLPEININSLFIQTDLDEEFVHADLIANIGITNEGRKTKKDISIQLELLHPVNNQDIISEKYPKLPLPGLKSGKNHNQRISLPVKYPLKWDCENPNLYELVVRLYEGEKEIETIHQKVGFREVEVQGNQLLVNGMPVKLRGVNRHEVYPLTGRTVPKEMYRRDVELFREGNVNHIRTSHYPPDEALMEAADELGMFIECEGPFCWSHETKGDSLATREIIKRQLLEMVIQNRNHPSILFWSLANESIWTEDYRLAGEALTKIDPTRPLTFNYFPWGWVKNNQEDESVCEIGSDHYPSPKGPGKYSDYHRPINFGEFVHLNAYNRYELATDVALRDKWGIYLHDMWEDMYKSQGVAGGSIWAGIDDTFYWDFPNQDGSSTEHTVGYGTWGPIDGWRRKKPEWWGMKKTYSPVRIIDVERGDNKVKFMVENRQDFSNLGRLLIKWKIGNDSGSLKAKIKARESGFLEIKSSEAMKENARLELEFVDPRGFVVDNFNLFIDSETNYYESPVTAKVSMKVENTGNYISVKSKEEEYRISTESGMISFGDVKGANLMILPMNNGGDTQMHGPTKYYEPYNPVCLDWTLDSLVNQFNSKGLIIAYGHYKEAKGSFTYEFRARGGVTIDYNFELKEDINPRQIGLVLDLPLTFENLYWKRNGYWSTYPDWHIARLEGKAKASEGVGATPVGPRTEPKHEWRHDRTSIGSNDFASTKHNFVKASLSDNSGKQVAASSFYGKSHSRTWIEENGIRWLIASYSNGGSERFLRPHAEKDDIYLKIGDVVKGSVSISYDKGN